MVRLIQRCVHSIIWLCALLLNLWGIDMEARVKAMCGRVMSEVFRSIDIHGDWSDYSDDQMTDAITGEMMEIDMALQARDVDGDHGMVREAVQAAACLIKFAVQQELRHGL